MLCGDWREVQNVQLNAAYQMRLPGGKSPCVNKSYGP